MNNVMVFCLIVSFVYVLVQFARQDYIKEYFEEAIIDIEGRMEWARTRNSCPFGMEAQLEVSGQLMGKAKNLWEAHKWDQAYQVALQSQEAMNRAQNIYSSFIEGNQRRNGRKQ